MFYFFSSQYCLSKKLSHLHYLVIFDTEMTNKWKTRFDKHQTVDGNLDVPKRYLYINLKFGQPFLSHYPIFPLDLRVEALDKLSFIIIKIIVYKLKRYSFTSTALCNIFLFIVIHSVAKRHKIVT